MKELPERVEAHCPRCQAAFVLATGPRGKKIQCPKCRQTIAVGLTLPRPRKPLPDPPPRTEPAATVIDALFTPTPRATELPVADPGEERTSDELLLRPGAKLRWLRREEPTGPAAQADEEQQAVLLHNLRAMGRRDIDLGAALNDAPGQQMAERLSAIFRAAGWNVRQAPPTPPRLRGSGLVLAAGQCPLPQAATAVYMALKAAGFPITTRLDGTFGPEQSLLITGGSAN